MQRNVPETLDFVDRSYFVKLAAMDPMVVCGRACCSYDAAEQCYVLPVWGRRYAIYPHGGQIVRLGTGADPCHGYFPLFVIYYLLNCSGTNPCGHWVSEKDLPGGPTFFRGPHEIPTRLISERFGNDVGTFRKVAMLLGGIPLNMGDAAFRFEVTSRIPVAVLLWKGDHEFPPEARIMYDRTISRHLTLDIVFALATEICTRLGRE